MANAPVGRGVRSFDLTMFNYTELGEITRHADIVCFVWLGRFGA